jgi:adenosylmethionine-8-amino-7-oxononanoate aminotransferase
MVLGHMPAGQPYPYRPIQPTRARRQRRQQGLSQDETLARGRHRPKTQFASLISAVQHNAPAEGRPLLPIPFEHPDQLLAQSVDYQWRWHGSDRRKGLPHRPSAAGLAWSYAECGPNGAGRWELAPWRVLLPLSTFRDPPMTDHSYPHSQVFYRKLGRRYPRIVRADGCYLYDAAGKRYLDGSGGAYVVNVGHGVTEIADALACQAATVAYVNGTAFTHDAVEELAGEVARLCPGDLELVYPLASGSEAVEAALKLARQYWVESERPGKEKVVALAPSYHGNTLLAMSASSREPYRSCFRPWLVPVVQVPAPYPYRCECRGVAPLCPACSGDAVEAAILQAGPETVAALIGEPVGGSATGASVPELGYWRRIREICDRYEILWVADEVLTGAGRTGTWSALEPYGAVPDLLVLGKGIAGGYAPLSAVVAPRRLVDRLAQGSGLVLHAQTFSHHPTLCAAGVATIKYLRRHQLIERCAAMGRLLHEQLAELRASPLVGDVRGKGLLAGIEFVADRETRRTFPPSARVAERVASHALDLGLTVWPNSGHLSDGTGDLAMLAPPFIISEEQIAELVVMLTQAIANTAREVGIH